MLNRAHQSSFPNEKLSFICSKSFITIYLCINIHIHTCVHPWHPPISTKLIPKCLQEAILLLQSPAWLCLIWIRSRDFITKMSLYKEHERCANIRGWIYYIYTSIHPVMYIGEPGNKSSKGKLAEMARNVHKIETAKLEWLIILLFATTIFTKILKLLFLYFYA